MDQTKLFNYEGTEIRTFNDVGNMTWFAGVDICVILGYSKPLIAIKKLDADERELGYLTDTSGQKRKTWSINEPGLYSLILSSTKSEAKAFKRWVTHEVLPTIRKAGNYSSEEQAEKDLNLQRLHSKMSDLEDKRSVIYKDIRAIRVQFNEMLYTDPNQLKIKFNKEVSS